jgi:hypothetical protein
MFFRKFLPKIFHEIYPQVVAGTRQFHRNAIVLNYLILYEYYILLF